MEAKRAGSLVAAALITVAVAIAGCKKGSSDSSSGGGAAATSYGTITATVNGAASTYSIGIANGCRYFPNANPPTLNVDGITGNLHIQVILSNPAQGGSYTANSGNILQYSPNTNASGVTVSSSNSGGSGSMALTLFPGTVGSTITGTFSGTLTGASLPTATVTAGSFSCTLS